MTDKPISEEFTLISQNLIPFYLIEDKMRTNFGKIGNFIVHTQQRDSQISKRIKQLQEYNVSHRQELNQKFVQMQRKIIAHISSDLQGRITVAVNKKMQNFNERMQDKEREIEKVSGGIEDKLQGLKKQLTYQISKDNQKYFIKEIDKFDKKIQKSIELVSKKVQKGGVTLTSAPSQIRLSSNVVAPQQYISSDHSDQMRQLQSRIVRLEQFIISFDKRFHDSMNSLKQSWKELGEELLDNKRKTNSKIDQFRLELIKIKGVKELQGGPEEVAEGFKKTIMDRFNDIYQLVSNAITRNDFQGEIGRIKKIVGRHGTELVQAREEMARNSDYFTFYMNNSNEENLTARIADLQADLQKKWTDTGRNFIKHDENIEYINEKVTQLTTDLSSAEETGGKLSQQFQSVGSKLIEFNSRIDALQDLNNFTPQKMSKIHNTLDIDFSPSEHELLAKKNVTLLNNQTVRELRLELSKVKDEVFVLNNQILQMEKIKKSMVTLEGKLDKVKNEAEEAVVIRKPWVCLSCDKNEKDDKLKRDVSRKRLSDSKPGGLFGKQRGDRFKMVPSEDKFQIYEKYREKYLSDAIKLPEIYREKFGDKEINLE